MTDYRVSDHWTNDDPDWLKSLVSSLDRRHGVSDVLPLTVLVDEILEWLQLASGTDAWRKPANQDSFALDIDDSTEALGGSLRRNIDHTLTQFRSSYLELINSPRAVLEQPPGLRSASVWNNLELAARNLLGALETDEATRASWEDLVETAKNRTLDRREYRPIAELFFDQLRRRGVDAEAAFDSLVDIVAFGQDPEDHPFGKTTTSIEERMERAQVFAGTPAVVEPTVVWLGYQGRAFPHLSLDRVAFIDAHWAVPNAKPEGFDFEHKEELWELVRGGVEFQVAQLADEKSDVDFLVRVDLGNTTVQGAVERAVDLVTTILNVSIHNSGGLRPLLAQHGLLRSGRPTSFAFLAARRSTGFPNDTYGADLTAEAVGEHGPRIAQALAREDLPRFLAAALEVQTTAEYPFSRDMALRKPSEADFRSVIPLADRVVQHIAAYASVDPNALFDTLGERWPHARWLTDVQRAVHMCLLGGGEHHELVRTLRGEWFSSSASRPWILFVANHLEDLLAVCRVEHERAWIKRMLKSTIDIEVYRALVDGYALEGTVLAARRRRVRNALVHGNPASFITVMSVRDYADFLGGTAMNLGLESYVEGSPPAEVIAKRSEEFVAMRAGSSAVEYWTVRASAGSPYKESS